MAEVFLIGNIQGTSSLKGNYCSCQFSLHLGNNWELVEGATEGRTQMAKLHEGSSIWQHPIDIHLAAHTFADWPKLLFRVYCRDFFETDGFAGYGLLQVPSHAGHHKLDVPLWRPEGSFKHKLEGTLLGGHPEFEKTNFLFQDSLPTINVVSVGSLQLELNVVHRGFDRHGVVL
ncbi:hypothetical protein P9112_008602 [Eukaryota sp. TZLM1-RC]